MITTEQDLGNISKEYLNSYLKENFMIGETNVQLPNDFDVGHEYPYCIQYSIEDNDYYLIVCKYYDSFSSRNTYYLIDASIIIDDDNNNGDTTMNYIKSTYLKPIAGSRNVWTEWTSEDPYAYNFLKACGGAGSNSSQITFRKWVVK